MVQVLDTMMRMICKQLPYLSSNFFFLPFGVSLSFLLGGFVGILMDEGFGEPEPLTFFQMYLSHGFFFQERKWESTFILRKKIQCGKKLSCVRGM